eukprot:582406-Prorocentrum_minimum.AAC.1
MLTPLVGRPGLTRLALNHPRVSNPSSLCVSIKGVSIKDKSCVCFPPGTWCRSAGKLADHRCHARARWKEQFEGNFTVTPWQSHESGHILLIDQYHHDRSMVSINRMWRPKNKEKSK